MFSGPSSDWNQKKIKAIIEHYGHQFFVHKKVLDLGCGLGDIGGVLHRLGADVTAVDARQDHLKMVAKKYSGVKTIKADLDGAWPFYGKNFDVIVDIGVMCHLKNFEEHLRNVCASTTYLILETAVSDSDDAYLSTVSPDSKNSADGSYNGFCSQVTANNIERILHDCGMTFKRFDSPRFNSGSYSYDWQLTHTKNYSVNKRRIWFCTNKQRNPDHIASMKAPIAAIPPPPTPTPGTFSSRLNDSKIPVVHKRIAVTKSPSVPGSYKGGDSITSLTPPRALSGGSNLIKVRLFYNYYEDPNPTRRAEIITCLEKNMDNPLFDLIVIGSDQPPTFEYIINAINIVADHNDISIICNSDIFFDGSIKSAFSIQSNELYALSRWDYLRNNFATFSHNSSSQDAWIVRGKIHNVDANFPMGRPGSSGKLAYAFQKAGYTVSNPSRTIKVYHVHQSGIRHYTEADRVPGPYLEVNPTALT